MAEIKKIIHKGEIQLGNDSIPCYVLEGGIRVLSEIGIQYALNLSKKGDKSSGQLFKFLNHKSLKPFVNKCLNVGIECYDGDKIVNGYEAGALIDICDAVLEARSHVKLTDKQALVANKCETLIISFAKTGVVALSDEITGHQYDRNKDALQKNMMKYIPKNNVTDEPLSDFNKALKKALEKKVN